MSGSDERRVRRAVVLANTVVGGGGIGEVSRLVVRSLLADPTPLAVEVLALDGAVTPPGLAAARVRSAGGSRLRMSVRSLRAALRPADLVVATHLNLAVLALPQVARGARLAVFLHGIDAWTRLPWHRRGPLKRAHVLLAVSRHTADRFLQAQGPSGWPRLEVCHLGASDVPAPARAPSDRPTALIVGRLSAAERYKGHDELLEIWPEVKRAVDRARLLVVGDGDDRGRLEALSRALGLEDDVVFLGRVPDEELPSVYARSDVFVMPSRGEGFGLVYVEAMRAGLPCVGGRGAAEEVIEHGRTGLIVDVHDRAALREAVAGLLSNRARAADMGRAGRARFEALFTERAFRERFRAAVGLASGR